MTSAENSSAPIFLVGFMGSGKSTVGRHLARIMNLRFIDLDERIEAAAGAAIARIFERDGEARFRSLESRQLREIARERGVVVAAGGGTMVAAENRELMARSGTTVWLKPDVETLVTRLGAGPAGERPLYVDPEQARELYRSREPGYGQADHEVEIGAAEGAEAVALRVAGLLRGDSCAT